MKIAITGLQRKSLISYIEERFQDFEIVEKKPEIVVAYGGDGTLLYAERKWPGVPKAMIRNSQVCTKCSNLARDTVLRLLQEQKFEVREHIKIEGSIGSETFMALNDVVVGRPGVNGTLRYRVRINGEDYGGEIFGDGIVVSTPIGSTGYYQSITRSNFAEGIGIAFNNSVRIVGHLVLREDAEVEIEVTRGPGTLGADNDEHTVGLSTGDKILVRKSKEVARIVEFPSEHRRFNVTTTTNRVPNGFCQICKQQYGS